MNLVYAESAAVISIQSSWHSDCAVLAINQAHLYCQRNQLRGGSSVYLYLRRRAYAKALPYPRQEIDDKCRKYFTRAVCGETSEGLDHPSEARRHQRTTKLLAPSRSSILLVPRNFVGDINAILWTNHLLNDYGGAQSKARFRSRFWFWESQG